jgi:hypothetical protein
MASPVAPDPPERPQNETAASVMVRMSGWVYASAEWGDPPIADALVEVRSSDGSTAATRTDTAGYYDLTVSGGTGVVSITTTKVGYLPTTREITLIKQHTVLNFFLTPDVL